MEDIYCSGICLLPLCKLMPPDFPDHMKISQRQNLIESCPSWKAYHELCLPNVQRTSPVTVTHRSQGLDDTSTTSISTQVPTEILHSLLNDSNDESSAWVAPLVLFLVLSTTVLLVALWYYRRKKLWSMSIDMKMYTETNYLHNKAIRGERWRDRVPSVPNSTASKDIDNTMLYQDIIVKKNTEIENENNHHSREPKQQSSHNGTDKHNHIYVLPNIPVHVHNSITETVKADCEDKKSFDANTGAGLSYPGDTVAAVQGMDNPAYEPEQLSYGAIKPTSKNDLKQRRKKWRNIKRKTSDKQKLEDTSVVDSGVAVNRMLDEADC